MLYSAYQAHTDMLSPIRALADAMSRTMTMHEAFRGAPRPSVGSNVGALYELIARFGLRHERPAYAIHGVTVENRIVPVREEAVDVTPFCTLLRFNKEIDRTQPRVLIVAPLSGHFATLLRDTVRTMLPDHDVYITDWQNARDVPVSAGAFGFDDYVDVVIRFLEKIGPGAHVVAVCQPCVATLVAASVMAQRGDEAQPSSLTLMAGPIDARVSATKVNELAKSRPIDWFESNLIARVPSRYGGAGRKVYPGFVQLYAFMCMNMERHLKAHRDLYNNLANGEHAKAAAIKAFYDEYFAVLDLTAEFYLETVRLIFQEYALPTGKLAWKGERIEPRAIRRTMLLTVEGENDDISGVGQTEAAHRLCTSIPFDRKAHWLQPAVGHYGVFNGSRFRAEIVPRISDFVLSHNAGSARTVRRPTPGVRTGMVIASIGSGHVRRNP